MPATQEQKLHAELHAIALLNELESTLRGWVLQHDDAKVRDLCDPIYELLDRD